MIRPSRDPETSGDLVHDSPRRDPIDAAPQPVWRAVLRGHFARRHGDGVAFVSLPDNQSQ